MAWFDHLLQQGYLPPGAKEDNISPVLKSISGFLDEKQAQDEKQMKKVQNQSTMYRTLRDAGYTPEKAHQAILDNGFPKDVPTEQGSLDLKNLKTKTSIGKEKSATDLNNARTNYVEEKTTMLP